MKNILLLLMVCFSSIVYSQSNKPLTQNQKKVVSYINTELKEITNSITPSKKFGLLDNHLISSLPYKKGQLYKIGKKVYVYESCGCYFEICYDTGTYSAIVSKTVIPKEYYIKQKNECIRMFAFKWMRKNNIKKMVIPYWLYK